MSREVRNRYFAEIRGYNDMKSLSHHNAREPPPADAGVGATPTGSRLGEAVYATGENRPVNTQEMVERQKIEPPSPAVRRRRPEAGSPPSGKSLTTNFPFRHLGKRVI